MNNTVLMILLLGLILMAVLSPFAALAMLMLVIFVSALGWVLWTLVRTLIRGDRLEQP
jgi:predicted lipid-binding transport protein (Tim44 family)